VIAYSPLTFLFAGISVVSALALAYLMLQESRRETRNNGMAAFQRHLNALSDDSRAHLRQRLQESKNRIREER
jgi:hypothetical protein